MKHRLIRIVIGVALLGLYFVASAYVYVNEPPKEKSDPCAKECSRNCKSPEACDEIPQH